MAIQKVSSTNQNKANVYLASGVGAVAGAGARYILPTKSELSSMINKGAVDSFTKTSAMSARGASRSIAKYGAIGAFLAGAVAIVHNMFSKDKKPQSVEYTKIEKILNTPDSVFEIYLFSDK